VKVQEQFYAEWLASFRGELWGSHYWSKALSFFHHLFNWTWNRDFSNFQRFSFYGNNII